MATLKDIAKRSGVSVCTVSRFLNGEMTVKKETERRIRHAVTELGYVPNVVAKSLKQHRTKNVAVILPNIDGFFYAAMTSGISEVLGKNKFNLFIYEQNNLNLNEEEILQLMRENMVAGVIFIGLSYDLAFKDKVWMLKDWHIPTVYMNREISYEGYPLIYPDFSKAGEVVAEHLRCRGKQKTAIVYKNKSKAFIDQNVRAFSKTCAEESCMPRIDLKEATGADFDSCVDRLIERRVDSVFVLSELLAVKLEKFLLKRRVRIPDDIAVVGFGNSLMSEVSTPGLTCLDFGDKDMGRKSAQLILRQINSEEVKAVTKLPVTLRVREST